MATSTLSGSMRVFHDVMWSFPNLPGWSISKKLVGVSGALTGVNVRVHHSASHMSQVPAF